jgi:hypothetical protein
MSRRSCWIALVVFLVTVCAFLSSSAEAPAPEPPDVSIESADPAVPPEVKNLLGKWHGQWNSRWDTVLYIEKVDRDSARLVLAFGEYNTTHGTCHCAPNWVRVQTATVKLSGGKATLQFFTPKFRPRWLKESHTVTGSFSESYPPNSAGLYKYFFTVNAHEPGTMKGTFRSAKNSLLTINMQKVE